MTVVTLWIGLPGAWAQDPSGVAGGRDRVDEMLGRYNLHPAFDKLGRGVSNAFFGWTEVPLNVGYRYSRHDTGGSLLTGAAIGLFKGLVRTGVGVYETVTFFLPYPEEFAPILPTLEYFKKASRRKALPLE
jgi:putative exosortase-associated protein (TIGR04073 family)